MAGHFAVSHLYAALSCSWWWEGMYTDVYKYCRGVQQPQGEEESPSHYYIQSRLRDPFKLLG